MDGFCPFERYFIGRKVEHAESVILEAELFDGIDGIAVELVLPEGQLLKTAIDLQHFGEVNGAFLSDTLILWGVKAE